MQFLKKHFEKIILSAVLVGLGAAAFWLSVAVKDARESLTSGFVDPPPARPLPGVESNLALLRVALQRLTNAPTIALSGDHNVFNPVTWRRAPDGKLFKMTRSGVEALEVTKITPLYFTISLISKVGEGYKLTAQPPKGPKVMSQFARLREKPTPLKPYTIAGTNAPPENPTLLAVQLLIPEGKDLAIVATNPPYTVTTNAPYKRLVGYEADLKYSGSDITNVFTNQSVNDSLLLSGESFKIIKIESNAVTVQDARTAQKTEKEWKGGP